MRKNISGKKWRKEGDLVHQSHSSSLLELRKFTAPEFVFGVGSRKLAGQYARNFGARKILLVTDANLRENTPWVQEVLTSLKKVNLPCVIFDQVSPNPRSWEIMMGASLFSQEQCNALVAVGGGSVMDCAKGIGIVCANKNHILDFEGVDRVIRPIPPLLCIPTTSGTASEVSQSAIILNEQRKTKISIISKAVVPDLGLLDPEVTTTMSPQVTAFAGIDALSHAVEAYVSNASSPITDIHAVEAIRLIWEALPEVITQPSNLNWRAQMLLGSLQAGLAFSNANLGAIHSMSHSLGGYLDAPHGELNAILFGTVIKYNYPACPERFNRIGQLISLSLDHRSAESAADALSQTIQQFRYKIGITSSLRDFGVNPSILADLAANAAQDPNITTNPRSVTQVDLEELYEQVL